MGYTGSRHGAAESLWQRVTRNGRVPGGALKDSRITTIRRTLTYVRRYIPVDTRTRSRPIRDRRRSSRSAELIISPGRGRRPRAVPLGRRPWLKDVILSVRLTTEFGCCDRSWPETKPTSNRDRCPPGSV